MKLRILTLGSTTALLIHKVEVGNRLRLPIEIDKFLPWLKQPEPKGTMFPGFCGGVQILHESVPGGADLQQILSATNDVPARPHEAKSDWMRLIRFQLTHCEVVFTPERSRYAVVLPREFRHMGLLPDHPKAAAIMVVGGILEIWPADEWAQYARAAGGAMADLSESIQDELEGR
jgi:hypothetical protein